MMNDTRSEFAELLSVVKPVPWTSHHQDVVCAQRWRFSPNEGLDLVPTAAELFGCEAIVFVEILELR